MTHTEAASEEAASVPAGGSPERIADVTVTEAQIISQLHPVGLYMASDHRYWMNGIGPFPSVTTVLGILDKPAVTTWKAKETARAMFALHLNQATEIENGAWSEEDAIRWALAEADKQRDSAAKLGSSVHLLADLVGASETGSIGFEVSEQEKPYVDAYRGFLSFLEAQGGSIVSSEHAVWNQNGYAGTYDLIVYLKGDLWLIDIKTSKGIYPDYGLQLAAYRYGENIVLPNDSFYYPMPEIQHTGILHLRPDAYPKQGWKLFEYVTGERDYIAFLGALEVFKWKQEGRFYLKDLITVSEAY